MGIRGHPTRTFLRACRSAFCRTSPKNVGTTSRRPLRIACHAVHDSTAATLPVVRLDRAPEVSLVWLPLKAAVAWARRTTDVPVKAAQPKGATLFAPTRGRDTPRMRVGISDSVLLPPERPEFATCSAARRYSMSSPPSDLAAHSARPPSVSRATSARWYARQAAKNVLVPADLAHLAVASTAHVLEERLPSSTTSTDHPQPTFTGVETAVNVFLGCALRPQGSHAELKQLFHCLPLIAQAQTIHRLARHDSEASTALLGAFPLEDMTACFLAALAEAAPRAPYRREVALAAWLVVESLDAGLCESLNNAHVCLLLQVVLHLCATDGAPSTLPAPTATVEDVVKRVLHLGEAAGLHRGEYGRRWCGILEQEAALLFEACAYGYREDSSRSVLYEPPRLASPLGYGTDVCALLDAIARRLNEDDGKTARARLWRLCDTMPPHLRLYVMNLSAVVHVRAAQEAVWKSNDSLPLLPANHFPSTMTELQFCSHVHFALESGNRQSAETLLAQSRTRQQVLTTMQHTKNAGCAAALAAAGRLLNLRSTGNVFAVLRFGPAAEETDRHSPRATVCFELSSTSVAMDAPAGEAVEHLTASTDEQHVGENEATRLGKSHIARQTAGFDNSGIGDTEPPQHASYGRLSREHVEVLRRALQTTCPGALQPGSRSLDAALASVSASAVPFVVGSLGVWFTSDVASWWATTTTKAGKLDVALSILKAAHARGVLPHMGALVLLLESASHKEQDLRAVIEFLETQYAAVADTVLRAFVERAASRMGCDAGGRVSPQRAMELMSTVAMLGLRHYPIACLHTIALEAPSPAVLAMLRLMQERKVAVAHSPVRLHIVAVERVIEALEELGLSPQVDVYAVCPLSRNVSWWSSSSWQVPRSVVTASGGERIYHTGAAAMWATALQELSWRTVDAGARSLAAIHKALRIIALGCSDGRRVVQVFVSCKPLLMAHGASARVNGRRREDGRRELQLMHTIAFMADALSRRGFWEEALQLFPQARPEALPPLLKIARLCVIRRHPDFRRFGALSLESEVRSLVDEYKAVRQAAARKRWRHKPMLRRRRRQSARRSLPPRVSSAHHRVEETLSHLETFMGYPRPLRRLLQLLESP